MPSACRSNIEIVAVLDLTLCKVKATVTLITNVATGVALAKVSALRIFVSVAWGCILSASL